MKIQGAFKRLFKIPIHYFSACHKRALFFLFPMSQTFDTHERNASEVWKVLDQKRLGHSGTPKIGLVVQGGGMRGVYSMGALAALEEMGFGQFFDHVAGSSAGALNGAYFITGQAGYGVETYIKYGAGVGNLYFLCWICAIKVL